MARLLKPCIECGALSHNARCPTHDYTAIHQRAHTQRRAEAARGGTNARARLRAKINREQYAQCNACGYTFPSSAIEVDHIKPLLQGGTDTDDNVQPLCLDCHQTKSRAERNQ